MKTALKTEQAVREGAPTEGSCRQPRKLFSAKSDLSPCFFSFHGFTPNLLFDCFYYTTKQDFFP